MLEREEYVEQAYFFRALRDRFERSQATQDLLVSLREEVLATTRLPLAIDFLCGELKLSGVMAPAMARLSHYFTPFQAYVMGESEKEQSRFDFFVALQILEQEAKYRAGGFTPQGAFMYQFEALCRNRLGYDFGLEAIGRDPIFDESWREWIATVRRQIGIVDLAELIYVRSEHYVQSRERQGLDADGPLKPVLFGEKEGRIALAHRRKEPLWLFSAMQRHLNYPEVPRARMLDENKQLLPQLMRRMDRVEMRIKLLEEEGRGGIDLSRFSGPQASLPDDLQEPPE